MERLYRSFLACPIGRLELISSRQGLVAMQIGTTKGRKLEAWTRRYFPRAETVEAGEEHLRYCKQIQEYFEGRRRIFDLPLDLRGSAFQRAVWTEVARIPFGRIATYGQIAHMAGRPRAGRAVGAANGANPIPIIIPCHRVIGANGSLVGYGGGLATKRWLLAHEGVLRTEAVQMDLLRAPLAPPKD